MRLTLSCALAALLIASWVPAQSLGSLAAQEKARREREKKAKAPKVYTDEDLASRAAPSSGPSEASSATSASAPSQPESAPERASESEPGDDSDIKARVAEAQAGLEGARQAASAAEAEVERLKQDLNPMSVTFKTDPYEILKLQAALTEAQAKAAEAQRQVQAAQAAMDAVRDEARRAGVRTP